MPREDRPSGDRGRLPPVDGLRALGLLLVFGFHTWEFAGRPDLGPVSAVIAQNTRPDLFIVLTGFVLYLPFARDPARASRFSTSVYLRRRLRRIVLPYYVALALPLSLSVLHELRYRAAGGRSPSGAMPSWADVITHLTFTHMFFPDTWASVNGSLWTMALEMQLYLLFPVVVLLYARFRTRALLAMLGANLIYRVLVALLVEEPFPTRFLWIATAPGRLAEFLAGIVVADIAWGRWSGRRRPRVAVQVVVALTCYLFAAQWPLPGASVLPFRDLLLGTGFGLLILLVLEARLPRAVFGARPLSGLGYMTYSLFLVHQPVAWYANVALRRAGLDSGLPLLLALWTGGFAAVLAVGWVLHRTVEIPCIRWSHALSPSGRTPARDVPARHAPVTSSTQDSEDMRNGHTPEGSRPPTISACIITYERPGFLARCLDSLSRLVR